MGSKNVASVGIQKKNELTSVLHGCNACIVLNTRLNVDITMIHFCIGAYADPSFKVKLKG